MRERKTAVLLLAHGTPEELQDIPKYLSNVVSGRPMPQSVIDEITHRYGLIGKSPLTALTLEQARLLAEALRRPVYVGMRNWKPYIVDTVKQMKADGITEAVAICLAPQNSRTSVGLYRRAVFAEAGESMRVEFIDGWADHPLLAEAFAERLRPVLARVSEEAGAPAVVLFTAHSVPCRTIQTPPAVAPPTRAIASAVNSAPAAKAPAASLIDTAEWVLSSAELPATTGRPAAQPDPYPLDAKHTARMVAARTPGLSDDRWHFAFQSQGMAGGPWIGPTVEDTLSALHQQGVRAVVLHTIGFLCDHVEILYDIDIAFREFAEKLGMRLERPLSLNGSPLLTEALVDLAEGGLTRLNAASPLLAEVH